MKNNLLIVTYYWPPSGGSGVQRWINLSNELTNLGWNVSILTTKNANYDQIDNSLSKSINKKIKVLKVPIFEPARFFKKTNNKSNNSNNLLKKLTLWIRANFFFPDSRMFWIKKASRFAIDYIKNNNINCVITTAPPFSSHLIGLNIKTKTNIKWISDFRDPWSSFFQFKLMPINFYLKNKHQKFEQKCIVNSDCVITTSPSLTKIYSKKNINSHTITNGFNSFIEKTNDNKFTLVYSGLMKSVQNPKNLWKVLHEICIENTEFKKDFSLKLIGDIDHDILFSKDLEKIKKNVHFQPYLDKSQLDNEVSKARVLILSSVNMNNSGLIIPGKLFYYFSFKRPIIGFCSKDDDTAKIINKTKSGKVFDYIETEKLKNYILELYINFKTNKSNFNPVNLKNYNYAELSKDLNIILKKTIY